MTKKSNEVFPYVSGCRLEGSVSMWNDQSKSSRTTYTNICDILKSNHYFSKREVHMGWGGWELPSLQKPPNPRTSRLVVAGVRIACHPKQSIQIASHTYAKQ